MQGLQSGRSGLLPSRLGGTLRAVALWTPRPWPRLQTMVSEETRAVSSTRLNSLMARQAFKEQPSK